MQDMNHNNQSHPDSDGRQSDGASLPIPSNGPITIPSITPQLLAYVQLTTITLPTADTISNSTNCNCCRCIRCIIRNLINASHCKMGGRCTSVNDWNWRDMPMILRFAAHIIPKTGDMTYGRTLKGGHC